MTKAEFRVLTAVEMGMKNHEFVSSQLIEQLAGLRRHSIRQILSTLLKNKLIFHCSKSYDGYKLTYLGYDYLALNALVKRGLVKGVGVRVGVGKESDIHLCEGSDGSVLVLKLHRLGRISFRSIKKNRDYMQHRTHCSWHYLAHLAAAREFAYLKALHSHGFPVPEPVDTNRHAVLMEYVDAIPLTQVRELDEPLIVLEKLMKLIVRLAHCGLIHGDFNEFNLMISDKGHITMIDLPQMVSIYHPNAALYFDRDVQCIKRLFERKFLVDVTTVPQFDDVVGRHCRQPEAKRADEGHEEEAQEAESRVDLIAVSDGLNEQQSKLLESAIAASREADNESPYSGSEESDEESDEEDASAASEAASSHEEGTDSEGEAKEEESCLKREVEWPADSDEDSQQAKQSSNSSESGSEEEDENPSRPLPPEEQQALIHCWRPAARRHTRDAVRKRVQAQNKKKKSKGNFGCNKNAEGIRARQMTKFDC
ncbi:RIO1 family domain-containing protein, putative [Eimeria praecox]|uniref:Serine/threonine-protein kinase RIO2 n=1 Tax=Eimeria praecox TaxID=51316 RepID=U6GSS9_9EIME|nr:RIO1 family domain-containing protein, putative [Eimeria praecox]